MGKHGGGLSPMTASALVFICVVLGGCILWVALTEGEAAIQWLNWILGQKD